jgi:hypothetical protein
MESNEPADWATWSALQALPTELDIEWSEFAQTGKLALDMTGALRQLCRNPGQGVALYPMDLANFQPSCADLLVGFGALASARAFRADVVVRVASTQAVKCSVFRGQNAALRPGPLPLIALRGEDVELAVEGDPDPRGLFAIVGVCETATRAALAKSRFSWAMRDGSPAWMFGDGSLSPVSDSGAQAQAKAAGSLGELPAFRPSPEVFGGIVANTPGEYMAMVAAA